MRTAAAAAVLGLAASWGCADPVRANVELAWTFGGAPCDRAGIETIHVDIPGELLTPSDFACLQPGGVATGARLGRFLLGTYSATVIGYDVHGVEVGRAVTPFTVQQGDNVVAVDVPVPPQGSVSLFWTFAGQTCAQAGVQSVRVSADGAIVADGSNNIDLPCTQAGQDGVQIVGLSPGQHSFDLVALRNGTIAYSTERVLAAVAANQDTAVHVDLPAGTPTSATADVFWGFVPGQVGAMTCAEAQVDFVRLFLDPLPNATGGTNLGDFPCTQAGVDGIEITGLTAGTHTFRVVAIRGGQLTAGQVVGGQLVYTTTRPTGNRFEVGLRSEVIVDADSVAPGVGNLTLQWDFSGVGGACQGSIQWTLTPPSGAPSSGSAPCASPSASFNGRAAGLWQIDARATVGGAPVSAQFLVGVPNSSTGTYSILFSK